MVNYGSIHVLQSLPKSHLYLFTHNLKTSGHIWTFSILKNCHAIGDILCVVESCMRDLTGELQPQTRISPSLIKHSVHILQAHTYITIWCAIMHDNKTHVPHDCILHTKQWLYCQQCIVL